MAAKRTEETEQCEVHSDLMEKLGGIHADLGWLKKAFWTVPVLLLTAIIAFSGYIRSLDNRLTACEIKIAVQRGGK